MTLVLRNQLEASERSARELEAQVQQQDSTTRYTVEDQLHSLVDIFASLTRDVERWQNSQDVTGTTDERELEWIGQFRRLEHLF